MPETARVGRLIYAVGVGLFGVALLAGIAESLRIYGRLPAIDLLGTGSKTYLKVLLARQDYDAAIRELEMQARMPPPNADTLLMLGELLGRQGRPEEARAVLQDLVRLKHEDAKAYCLLGLTYIDTKEPARATDYLRRAIDLDPKLASAFYGLGIAYAQLGELAEAEKCFAKVVELAPNNAEAEMNLRKAREELQAAAKGAKKG